MSKERVTMRPIDGEFVHSAEVRAAACAKAGHSPDYINLSVSGKVGRQICQCHCGEVNEAPEALKQWKAQRRKQRQAHSLPAGGAR